MNCIFETERLVVRELVIEDATELAKVLCNAISMQYYPKVFTEYDVNKWIEVNIDRYKVNGFGLWAVIRKSDNIFIGDCGITLQNIDNEVLPEVGFHIINNYCRNGYATEAALKSIEYVKERFKRKTVYSYCLKDNIPSQKVMNKIGMEYVKEYVENGKIYIVYKSKDD